MADRRRRKCLVNENSDCGSDDSGDDQAVNTSNQGSEAGNSEYESVDEDELLDDEVTNEGELAPPPDDSEEAKNLDHDEDRKNPQYIPKKGTFYEHDDRTMGEGEEVKPENEEESEAPPEKEAKKKVWKEDGKWQHDRFSIYDQSPKSREELVATYGYDIRNEEGPPRARRRRRYGRGPNKYTRNWEDMDAYSKPTRGGKTEARRGRGRGRKKEGSPLEDFTNSSRDFPSLPSNRDDEDQIESEAYKRVMVEAPHVDTPKYINTPNVTESYDNVKISKSIPVSDQGSNRFIEEGKREGRGGLGRGTRPNFKSRPGQKGLPRNHNYLEGGQFMNKARRDMGRGRGEGKPRSSGWLGHVPQQVIPVSPLSYQQKEIQEITEELKTVTITPSHKEDHHYKKRGMDNRRNKIPPRLQESMRGNKSGVHSGDSNSVSSKPKRYSSQRQRSLQDQIGQYHHPQTYYDQNSSESGYSNKIYEQTTSSPGGGTPSQLPLSGQAAQPPPPPFVAPYPTTSASTYPAAPPTRLFPSAPQPHLIGPPVAGPPIGAPPPVAGPGVPGPPVPGTVGGPPVTGPPFLPPENMINYAAGAPALVAAPHPPQFPPFQAFTPVSTQQPQEIYSNGVTYYNTQSQQHLPRINPVLQKRPKAAIPIVPPPERNYSLRQRNESEREIVRENSEIINENNSFTPNLNDYAAMKPDNLYQESEVTNEHQVYTEENASLTEEIEKPVCSVEPLEKNSLQESSEVKESSLPSVVQDNDPSSSSKVDSNCSEYNINSEENLDTTETNASTVNREEHSVEVSVTEKIESENNGSESSLDVKSEKILVDSEKISAESEVKVEDNCNPTLEAT